MLSSFLGDLAVYVQQGGFVMPPLFVATVILWFAIGVRYSILRRGNRRSVRVLIERAKDGRLETGRGIVDTAVLRGVNEQRMRQARTPSAGGEGLRPFLDDLFSDYDKDLGRYQRLIKVICAAAPLTGLLGTVTGMIETFDSLGSMSLYSQSGGIAGGISQALFTTQMGLAVAIPGLLVAGMLDRKQKWITLELAQIKDILCGEMKAGAKPGMVT